MCLVPCPQVDYIYAVSQTSANSNTAADFKKLEAALAELKPDERVLVSMMACLPALLQLDLSKRLATMAPDMQDGMVVHRRWPAPSRRC